MGEFSVIVEYAVWQVIMAIKRIKGGPFGYAGCVNLHPTAFYCSTENFILEKLKEYNVQL